MEPVLSLVEGSKGVVEGGLSRGRRVLCRMVDSGVGVGPQPRRGGADRMVISNSFSSLFKFISQSQSLMLHDDPHLARQWVVAGVVNYGQAQLVDPWWIGRGVPDIKEAACDRGFMNITEYAPGGRVLSRSHFDFVVLEIGDVSPT